METSELMTMFHAAQYAFTEGEYIIAESILREGAEKGHPHAQCMLGLMYELGRAVSQDYVMALEWYHKSADQGFADAQVSIGRCYDRGIGVPQDDAQAVAWFRKAADAGFADGQFELGQMYDAGTGVPQDDEKSLYWYNKAAVQGYAEAQYAVGTAYQTGRGVRLDHRCACDWFSKAAVQGHADAQGVLGAMYASGLGVPQDDMLARKWLGMASDQGVANAQYIYDLHYPDPVNGPRLPPGVVPGVVTLHEKLARDEQSSAPKNRHERRAAGAAIADTKRSRDAGLAEEARRQVRPKRHPVTKSQGVANHHISREGRAMNRTQYPSLEDFPGAENMQEVFEKTLPMQRELANHGHAKAQYGMGEAYFRGWGAPKDSQQAVEWYRKSAEQRIRRRSSGSMIYVSRGRGRGAGRCSSALLVAEGCSPRRRLCAVCARYDVFVG